MHIPAENMLDRMVEDSWIRSRLSLGQMLQAMIASFVSRRDRDPEFIQWSHFSHRDADCWIRFREQPPVIVPTDVCCVRLYADWGGVPKTLMDDPAAALARRKTMTVEINVTSLICLTDCVMFFEATFPRRRATSWHEVNADEGLRAVPWLKSADVPARLE